MMLNLKASFMQQSPAAPSNKFKVMKATLESKEFEVSSSI